MSLVQKGIVTAEEVDLIAKWGLGIRLAMTGPIEQRDINGLDIHLSITEYVYPTLENSMEPLPILKNHVQQGELGMKSDYGFYDWRFIDVGSYLNDKNETLMKIIQVVSEEKK